MINHTQHTEYVATRLGTLHVRIVGEGRTTVLWPSMFVDSSTWDRLIPHLNGGGDGPRRFVLIDPPGLGRSESLSRPANIPEAAEAARDALAVLAPDEAVDWVGNAFGGHVGFELARDATLLRSLVAISSPTEPIAPDLRRKIGILKPLLRTMGPVGPVRSAIIDAMLTDASAADPDIRSIVIESLQRPTRASLNLALGSFILNRADVTSRLTEIRVPSLFVASDDRGDWSPQDAARAAGLTPGARAVTVTAARTLVPLEQPAALSLIVRAFWDEV